VYVDDTDISMVGVVVTVYNVLEHWIASDASVVRIIVEVFEACVLNLIIPIC